MIVSPPQKIYRVQPLWRLGPLLLPAIAWTVVGLSFVDKQEPSSLLLGIAVALTTLYGLFWVHMGKAELSIHAEGIRRQTALGSVEMQWEEVSETRFTALTPLFEEARLGQWQLMLRSADGRELKITENWLDSDEAVTIALNCVNPRILEGLRSRFRSGGRLTFGDLSLSPLGVGWKDKDPIPFATLEKCEIKGANLCLRSAGRWLNDIRVNASKIPNVLVLLTLIDELRAVDRPAQSNGSARHRDR